MNGEDVLQFLRYMKKQAETEGIYFPNVVMECKTCKYEYTDESGVTYCRNTSEICEFSNKWEIKEEIANDPGSRIYLRKAD